MTTLIVALAFLQGQQPPATPSSPGLLAYALSPDELAVATQSQAAPALLPTVAHGEVVALIPARALSWHQVRLPKGTLARGFLAEGGSPRLRAVLEGLLEEHLLDEPAQLHFALAPDARDDAPAWVAVCDRASLKAGLQQLEAHGRAATSIVPEFAPGELHGAEGGKTLFVTGTADDAHLVVPRDDGITVLPLTAASVALVAWPEQDTILAEPAVAALAESLFNRRVGVQQSGQRWLQAAQSAWDLAQFDLVNTSRSRTWKRMTTWGSKLLRAPQWRAARWATVGLVAANLIGLNAWAWKEQSQLAAKRQAVRDVLVQTFPGVRVVVDAPVQMTRELALLRQAAGGVSNGDFERILESFGAEVPANAIPSAIEYVANEVRLKGLNLTSAQLAQATDNLRRQGMAVRSDGDAVVIRAEGAP